MKQFEPLNDYVLVEVKELVETQSDEPQLLDPDKDEDRINRGIVVHPGKYGPDYALASGRLEVGQTVYWVMFTGSGRTFQHPDGRQIAQIPYDRLTMREI